MERVDRDTVLAVQLLEDEVLSDCIQFGGKIHIQTSIAKVHPRRISGNIDKCAPTVVTDTTEHAANHVTGGTVQLRATCIIPVRLSQIRAILRLSVVTSGRHVSTKRRIIATQQTCDESTRRYSTCGSCGNTRNDDPRAESCGKPGNHTTSCTYQCCDSSGVG